MLPTEPEKMDFRRLLVVFSATDAVADPDDAELGIAMRFTCKSLFLEGTQRCGLATVIAGPVPRRERPGLEGFV